MIIIENLFCAYNRKKIIQQLDCSINDGLTMILGRNGCGKSTFMKTLTGIHKEYSGDIFFDNQNLKNIKINDRAKLLSYLPQTRRIPNITVFQYVLHGRYPHLSKEHRYRENDYMIVNKVLENFGLWELKDKNLLYLSGGERQKVYIALAMVQDTSYIFLDEPSTFLDMHYQFELMKILRSTANSGKKIIMIAHDLQIALNYADKIMVLNEGKSAYFGDPDTAVDIGIIQEVFHLKVRKVFEKEMMEPMYVIADSPGDLLFS